MKNKIFFLVLIFSLSLSSCLSQGNYVVTEESPATEISEIAPTSTLFWITPVPPLTALPTITPKIIEPFIPNSSDTDISNIIVQIYSIEPACTHSVFIDDPDIKSKVKFLDIAEPDSLNIKWVQAISYSPDKSHQAYIACVSTSPDSQGCSDHVYIKNNSSGKVFDIEFYGHQSWRPVFGVIWIGNNIVAFTENANPQVDTIYAVDLNKVEYAYLSLYYGHCK